MKTKLFSMLLMMAACVCISSCSDDKDDDSSSVVGTWDGGTYPLLCTLSFYENGTGEEILYNYPSDVLMNFTYSPVDKTTGTISGGTKYTIEGNKMYLGDKHTSFYTKRAKGEKFAYPIKLLYGEWDVKYVYDGTSMQDVTTNGYHMSFTFAKDGTYEERTNDKALISGTYEVEGFKMKSYVNDKLRMEYLVTALTDDILDMVVYMPLADFQIRYRAQRVK